MACDYFNIEPKSIRAKFFYVDNTEAFEFNMNKLRESKYHLLNYIRHNNAEEPKWRGLEFPCVKCYRLENCAHGLKEINKIDLDEQRTDFVRRMHKLQSGFKRVKDKLVRDFKTNANLENMKKMGLSFKITKRKKWLKTLPDKFKMKSPPSFGSLSKEQRKELESHIGIDPVVSIDFENKKDFDLVLKEKEFLTNTKEEK